MSVPRLTKTSLSGWEWYAEADSITGPIFYVQSGYRSRRTASRAAKRWLKQVARSDEYWQHQADLGLPVPTLSLDGFRLNR